MNADHEVESSIQESQLVSLVDELEQGGLTQNQQIQLAQLLKSASASVVMTATHHQSFSGPIPPPEQLAKYPEDARKLILDMAHREQVYTHNMNEKALTGAIQKDRLGQYIGGTIAIVGLVAAAWVVGLKTYRGQEHSVIFIAHALIKIRNNTSLAKSLMDKLHTEAFSLKHYALFVREQYEFVNKVLA